MKYRAAFFLLLMASMSLAVAQDSVRFEDYFIDKTMRIDVFHVGNASEEIFTVDQIHQQGIWAGSLHSLIDPIDIGRYSVKIYDEASGILIYSKGFDSYFGEYKTTDAALEGEKRTYHESALIPYPKKNIIFSLEVRNRENKLRTLFEKAIDPSSIGIHRDNPDNETSVFEEVVAGDPHRKVDIAIIGEGYVRDETEKFRADLKRFVEIFFEQEPYKTNKDSFNICGILKPSQESGCDEPRYGIYKNTALSETFNSLGSERYLLTEDNRALRDVAACVPYDALLIMVNHSRYGGGGIYNLYCTFTADNQWHAYLFLHEFGHSFAGLADEYYTSSIAYNDFYPKGVEPLESNITAFLDKDNVKWKPFLTEGIEIPTPWEKEEFDRMDNAYQKVREELNDKIAALKRQGAPRDEVARIEEESESLSQQHARRMDAYLAKSRFAGSVGVFEGAGYSARGLYRPMLDCLMFTKGNRPFCTVCEQAIIRVIRSYTE